MAISRFKTSTLAQGLPKYQDVWDGISAVFDSDYELIERVTVGAGNTGSVTFSSIPSTYKHLQIRGIGRVTVSQTWNDIRGRFNSDTGSNYQGHSLGADGSSVFADSTGSTSFFPVGTWVTAASAGANIFGAFICDILDYKDTNKYKTVKTFTGSDLNGSGLYGLFSGSWRNTSAVTSITLFNNNGGDIVQYSSFALYGIKGA